MVCLRGLEPPRGFPQRTLSPSRLPLRHRHIPVRKSENPILVATFWWAWEESNLQSSKRASFTDWWDEPVLPSRPVHRAGFEPANPLRGPDLQSGGFSLSPTCTSHHKNNKAALLGRLGRSRVLIALPLEHTAAHPANKQGIQQRQ